MLPYGDIVNNISMFNACLTLRLTTSSIDFNTSSNKKETPSDDHKKTKYKSQSQKQSNYTRKQNYLKQKFCVEYLIYQYASKTLSTFKQFF